MDNDKQVIDLLLADFVKSYNIVLPDPQPVEDEPILLTDEAIEEPITMGGHGIYIRDNLLSINKASESEIDEAIDEYKPIVPSNFRYALQSAIGTTIATIEDVDVYFGEEA